MASRKKGRKTADESVPSMALAAAEFDAREIGEAILADPLLVDCFRLLREEGVESCLSIFIVWQAKRGLSSFQDSPSPLCRAPKVGFGPSPRLEAYRLRRIRADKEPVLVGEGWDEAFAELMVDVVVERVRKAERCPAAEA